MLVDSEKLGSGQAMSEAEKMQRERKGTVSLKGIVDYDWSPDGKTILVPLDGELYLAGHRRPRQAGEGQPARARYSIPCSAKPASISRSSATIGCGLDRSAHRARPITPAEGELVHWGEAEFVAQEEIDRLTGYWWSSER